ncbi:MAG: DUF3343 domain-containing protein [Raoultibacter sp.]
MGNTAFYVLFHTHTDGLELYSLLKKEGFKPKISPVPPAAKACCGMSLLIDSSEIEQIKHFVAASEFPIDRIVELENQIKPQRDSFC